MQLPAISRAVFADDFSSKPGNGSVSVTAETEARAAVPPQQPKRRTPFRILGRQLEERRVRRQAGDLDESEEWKREFTALRSRSGYWSVSEHRRLILLR
jgi:hypothetical protein